MLQQYRAPRALWIANADSSRHPFCEMTAACADRGYVISPSQGRINVVLCFCVPQRRYISHHALFADRLIFLQNLWEKHYRPTRSCWGCRPRPRIFISISAPILIPQRSDSLPQLIYIGIRHGSYNGYIICDGTDSSWKPEIRATGHTDDGIIRIKNNRLEAYMQ